LGRKQAINASSKVKKAKSQGVNNPLGRQTDLIKKYKDQISLPALKI